MKSNFNSLVFVLSGVNRHFQMVFILDKLMASYKKLTSKHVWDCLGELYDLQALVRLSDSS